MTGSADESFDSLNVCLLSIPSGPVEGIRELVRLLSACWERFDGADSEGMAGDKLHGRMESVFSDPQRLLLKSSGMGRPYKDRHEQNSITGTLI